MNKLEYTKEDIIDLQNDIDKLYQENKELQTTVNNCKQRINKAIEILGEYKHYSVPDETQNSDNEKIVNNAYEVLKRRK